MKTVSVFFFDCATHCFNAAGHSSQLLCSSYRLPFIKMGARGKNVETRKTLYITFFENTAFANLSKYVASGILL